MVSVYSTKYCSFNMGIHLAMSVFLTDWNQIFIFVMQDSSHVEVSREDDVNAPAL